MRYLLIYLLLFNFFFAFAQKPKVTDDFSLSVGPKYKRISNTQEYHFVHGQQMLSLKKINKGFTLQRHTVRNLTKLPATSIIPDKGDFVSVMQLKDTVLVYYRQKNKLLTQKLRISAKVPITTSTVINAKNTVADNFGFTSRFGYDAGNRINAFAIKKSVDQSKFVIVYTDSKIPGNGKKPLKNVVTGNVRKTLNINIYNADMTLDWKRSIEMPYTIKKMNPNDFMVDTRGDFYVLATVFDKEILLAGKRNKKDSNFHMELFKINKDANNWEIKNIETPKVIEDAVLYSDTSKKPIIIGFYSEKELNGYVSGMFNATIDSNKTINPIIYPISTDTIKAYENRKAIQIKKGFRNPKEKEDLEDIQINKIKAQNDGSFTLFAEQRYAKRNSYYANGATTVKYDFYYKNAYATKIDGNGNLLWFNQLPKNQYGRKGKQTMSYQTLHFGNYSYVLLWEKFGNLYKNVGEFADLLDTGKREYLFIATYKINNFSGNVEKLPVINSLEVDRYRLSNFKMDKAVKVNESDIIFEGSSGKSNYLFRLLINKN